MAFSIRSLDPLALLGHRAETIDAKTFITNSKILKTAAGSKRADMLAAYLLYLFVDVLNFMKERYCRRGLLESPSWS